MGVGAAVEGVGAVKCGIGASLERKFLLPWRGQATLGKG